MKARTPTVRTMQRALAVATEAAASGDMAPLTKLVYEGHTKRHAELTFMGERVPMWKPPPWAGETHVRYERRTNWPPRYVCNAGEKGWISCDICCRQQRLWMTHDKVWKRLPRKMRSGYLCTACFRKNAPEPKAWMIA